jgi:hypothetical protein
MAARRRILLAILWIALLAVSVMADPRIDELSLVVGDSETLMFPDGANVQISRRGVVDLFHVGEGRWRVTALRAGVVVLSSGEGEGEAARRSIVRVTPVQRMPVHPDEELPPWVCATPGVRCDRAARIVDGVLPDAARFAQARALCERGACRFQALLTETARARWEAQLRALTPRGTTLTLSPAGVLYVETLCGVLEGARDEARRESGTSDLRRRGLSSREERTSELRAALRGRIESDDLLVRCAEETAPPGYRLETKIMRIAESQLAALGFAGTASLGAATPPWRLDAALATKLEAARRARRLEIIGEPSLRLVAGRRAEARSGGEFQVALHEPHAGEPRAVWKPFGLVLVATATPRDARTARLSYELSLSARDGEGVSAHGVKGELDLALGTPTLAAALDLASSDREDVSQALLSRIPILGPLFRLEVSGEQTSRVFAWFKLGADEGAGLRDAATAWPEER